MTVWFIKIHESQLTYSSILSLVLQFLSQAAPCYFCCDTILKDSFYFLSDRIGEVINPSLGGKSISSGEVGSPEANDVISEESCVSSIASERETDGMEVQSSKGRRGN